MKRRNFLKKSVIASASLITISKLVHAQNETIVYNGVQFYGSIVDATKVSCEMYKEVILDFDNSQHPADKKVVKFKVETFADDQKSVTATADYEYEIIQFDKLSDNTMRLKAKLNEKIKLDLRPDYLGNKIDITINIPDDVYEVAVATIDSKDGGYIMKSVPKTKPTYDSNYNGGYGCFLTTACTQAKGLPDDCIELSTLRKFRDNYMGKSKEGKALIEHYYEIAPRIVRKIDALPNRKAVYQEMYRNLVLVSKKMIEQNEMKAALHHYQTYTLGLEKILLN